MIHGNRKIFVENLDKNYHYDALRRFQPNVKNTTPLNKNKNEFAITGA